MPGRNERLPIGVIDGVAAVARRPSPDSTSSGDKELIARAVTKETAAGGDSRHPATPHGSLRYIAIPVSVNGDPQSGLYIRAIDLSAELEPVTAAMTTYIMAALVVLGAIGVVGVRDEPLLSPIRRMRNAAGRRHDQ